ncbi:hypothetical protein GCM10009116_22020 [Brevundimonas basaltis]|uniref:Uncharacterized protein n=1 Tax=Brevundimonas basaltis TaxID=472166 RepID=A0A7W8HXZ3_9CAUL|nr:hypothetical protein [Brevundimonas basaltis]MBB5291952.1 hypothetical protein [Brevundimonas basaltis]
MTSPRDPHTCRRALREIGEIAAVAGLEGGRMTDQETLGSIAAIAEWVLETAPGARADCGDVVRRLERMTAGVEVEALDDRAAQALFGAVVGVLEGSSA